MNISEKTNRFDKIITLCLSTIDNEERSKLENERDEIFAKTWDFLQIFQILMEFPETSESKRKYLLEMMKKKAQLITESEQHSRTLYKICVEKIFDETIKNQEKICYRDILKNIFSPFMTSNANIINELRNDFVKDLEYKINTVKNNKDVLGIIHCFFALFEPKKIFNPLQTFKEIFPKVETIKEKFINFILQEFESSKFNLTKINQNENLKIDFNEKLEILEIFQQLYMTCIKNFRVSILKPKILNLSSNEELIFFLHNFLYFQIGDFFINKNNLIFNPTEFENLNRKINNIKFFTLETILILFKLYNEKKENQIEKITFFYKSIINSLITNMNNFYSSQNFSLNVLKTVVKSPLILLIESATRFIYRATEYFVYHKCFFDNINDFLKNFVLLNLLTNPQKIENFEDEKEELVAAVNDMMSNNMGDNINILTAKALKKICEKIDGTLFFCFNLAIQMLESTLEMGENPQIKCLQEKYPEVWEIKDTRFFSQTKAINKIEVSLLILTVLSKDIKKRTSFLHKIERVFQKYIEVLISSNEFISFRFIYLVSCYIGHLYYDEKYYTKEGHLFFSRIFEYLGQCKNLSHSAVNLLESFVSSKKNQTFFFENFFLSIFNNILEEIKTSNKNNIFGLVTQFICDKESDILGDEELFDKILITIINRLQYEDMKIESKKNLNVIVQCWNILQDLSKSRDICVKYNNKMFLFLKNFVDVILKPETTNDFAEDFFNTIINVITNSKTMVPYYNELFNCIIIVQKKDEIKKNNSFLRSVINLIVKVFLQFENYLDQNKLNILVENSLFIFKNLSQDITVYILRDFFLLINLLIQKFGDKIPEQFLNEYFSIYVHSFELKEKIEYVSDKFIQINVEKILLSLIYKVPNFIIPRIEKTNLQHFFERKQNFNPIYLKQELSNLEKIMKIILNNYSNYENDYENDYENKLLIFAMINLFFYIYSSPDTTYDPLEVYLLSFLFVFLKLNAIKKICINLRKKMGKKKKLNFFENKFIFLEKESKAFLNSLFNVQTNKLSNQDSNDSDDDSVINFDYENNDFIIDEDDETSCDDKDNNLYSFSPLFNSNEYEVFRNLFENINNVDPIFLSDVKDKLDPIVIDCINDVLFRIKMLEIDNQTHIRIFKRYKR